MAHKSVVFCTRFVAIGLALLCPLLASGQTQPVPSRITRAVDETSLTTLRGNTHPLATPQFDRGVAPPSLPMARMLLVLKRSAAQETALDALLDQQQDSSSPNYHQWLSPDQFGQQFGPSDQDIQAITSWLQLHGFQIAHVSRGRTSIEFSGTASQIQEAFHTAIHKYTVNGADHWANSSDPQIPSALATVVAGVNTMHNFPREAMHHVAGVASRSKSTGKVTLAQPSLYSLSGNCGVQGVGCNAVGPFDFARIYSLLPLWTATPTPIDGTGQTIAIVGESDITTQDVAAFRTYFGLPAPNLQVIVDGPDPGFVQGDETESDLDVEWAGATAPGAMIDFVTSESTEASLGVDLSAQYIVDNNLAPILSESYGVCELFLGSAGNQFYNQLWQQAAAQGITVLVATGDSGSAVCDRNAGTEGAAQYGLSVSGISSTPYNVAVGGTDFNDLTNPSVYWAATNKIPPLPGNQTAIPTVSALSYIPETSWNDSCTNSVFGNLLGYSTNAETNCNNSQLITNGFVTAVGGSGGKSACTNSDGQTIATCTGGYAKPSWQTGTGVPSDGKRDLPDVALFAAINSPSGSFYVVCEADFNPDGNSCVPTNLNTNFLGVGGTSASTPALAGIMALVNQQTQSRQGNANYTFYKLAAQQPTAFNDVPAGGTIAMPCVTRSTSDCITSVNGDKTGVLSGYNTTSGYDLATGLGSVNANILVTKWSTITTGTKGTTTSLTLSPATSPIPHGTAVPISITVAPNPASSSTPTGQLSLITSTGESAGNFTLASNGSLAPGATANLLPGGNYTVTAHYAGDGTFAPSDSTPPISVTVAPEASKLQIAYELFDPITNAEINANASTAVFGAPSLLRINVTSNAGDACPQNAPGNAGCPTGSLVVTDNNAALDGGSFPLNSDGYAEDQLIFLTAGTHQFNASYSGDSSFLSNSASDSVVIQQATTSVTLLPAIVTIMADEGVQLEGTINTNSYAPGVAGRPTGHVQLFLDGSPLEQVTPDSWSTNPTTHTVSALVEPPLSESNIPAGNHTLTAQYLGDTNYAPSPISAPIALQVQVGTRIALTSSNSPAPEGQSVTFTAQISTDVPSTPIIAGTVQFNTSSLNGPSIGSAPVTNGQAQITTSTLPGGTFNVFATYSGNVDYASGAGEVSQTVIPFGTTTSVISSNPSIAQGASVTFTAQVTSPHAGTPAMTGTVQFSSNGSSLGSPVTLSNGQAQMTTNALPLGSDQITAAYGSDPNYSGSTSSAITETVSPAPTFTVTANPTAITVIAPGQVGSTVLTFTSQNGLTGTNMTVVAACSGLPSEATCSFSPTSAVTSTTITLPANGSTTATFYVLTTAPSSVVPTANNRPGGFGRWTMREMVLLAGGLCTAMLMMGFCRKRVRWSTTFAVLTFAFVIATAACGGGGSNSGGGGGGNPSNPGTPITQNAPISVSLTFGGISQPVPNLTVTVQ